MEEHVYSGSIIWWAADLISKVGWAIYPVVFMVIAILLVVREKSAVSYFALLGAVLACVTNLLHRYSDGVTSVALGYPVPHIKENILIWYLSMHGLHTGLLIFSGSLLWVIFRGSRGAQSVAP
ncbi:hypothetical protein [Oceanicoccus sp. KOV_DT_Chl]|uniref:hypothetical protein n=1 Tax=Oceanicoccus sp. KOV_DT_Chl TaxID=1904639 RepID=UPI000C7AACC2|nr:hypothetical protein [Oceanicoccus sp. KOV_DT_Chl]